MGKGGGGTRPPALDTLPRVGGEAESRIRWVAALTPHRRPSTGTPEGVQGAGVRLLGGQLAVPQVRVADILPTSVTGL